MQPGELAIKINQDSCSKCGICYSVCPFEAISLDTNENKVKINIEKCQVCGICPSACPSSAIESAYYDINALTAYLKAQMDAIKAKTLVLMCRGSSPPSGEISDILKEHKVSKFIPLRLPCIGRVSPEFYLRAISLGISRIIIIQCEEDFCRFKAGAAVSERRLKLLHTMLEQFGFQKNFLTIIKNPLRAVYDTEKCVGCDKCEFVCPYDAIELQLIGTPVINEICKGCGACAIVCPHLAIQVKGFEYEPSSQTIQNYKPAVKGKKKKDISPNILVLCCQWAEFSTLDKPKDNRPRENTLIINIPCLSKLDPVLVLQALRSSFDGVLAFGCSAEDCKLKEGREVAEHNFSALKETLDRLNLADRFEICYGSPRYVGDFDSKLDSFITKVSALAKSLRP